MGGRVAEELVYGKENVTDGASSDISNATSIASNMVRRFGFSDSIGPVSYMGGDSDQPPPSEETQRLIDSEVKTLIEQAQERARVVLASKKDELERLAQALVDFETLDLAEVQKGEEIVYPRGAACRRDDTDVRLVPHLQSSRASRSSERASSELRRERFKKELSVYLHPQHCL